MTIIKMKERIRLFVFFIFYLTHLATHAQNILDYTDSLSLIQNIKTAEGYQKYYINSDSIFYYQQNIQGNLFISAGVYSIFNDTLIRFESRKNELFNVYKYFTDQTVNYSCFIRQGKLLNGDLKNVNVVSECEIGILNQSIGSIEHINKHFSQVVDNRIKAVTQGVVYGVYQKEGSCSVAVKYQDIIIIYENIMSTELKTGDLVKENQELFFVDKGQLIYEIWQGGRLLYDSRRNG